MNLAQLASAAGVALLQSKNLTTVSNFYAENENPDAQENLPNTRDIPCVRCHFEQGDEYPMFTGNYSGSLVFQAVWSGDDLTADEVSEFLTEVFEAISTDTFAADLTEASDDFTCFGMTGGFQQGPQMELKTEGGRPLKSKSLTAPINCCASGVS